MRNLTIFHQTSFWSILYTSFIPVIIKAMNSLSNIIRYHFHWLKCYDFCSKRATFNVYVTTTLITAEMISWSKSPLNSWYKWVSLTSITLFWNSLLIDRLSRWTSLHYVNLMLPNQVFSLIFSWIISLIFFNCLLGAHIFDELKSVSTGKCIRFLSL